MCLLGISSHSARAEAPRFGVLTPLDRTTWPEVRQAWREIESLGFASAWVNDHLLPAPGPETDTQLESWTTLAALAVTTARIEVGVLVSGNTYRNPALLAKMATTVDRLSNGRLALGIGAAWFGREHEAYGFTFGSTKERAQRLEEALAVITRLWSGGGSYEGQYYSLDDAPFAPANLQRPRPPIIVGGAGKQWIVPLVGKWADGWNAAPNVTPDGFRERIEIIREACATSGRTDCPTRFSKVLRLASISEAPVPAPTGDPQRTNWVLQGTPDQITTRIQEFVDAGANELIVMLPTPYDLATLRRFASEVMPRFAGDDARPRG